ncbi:hypothetical protein BLA29_008197 [Euroglyphus maynei]|uniref:Uncharacterized protein n=1 Tax=Euroglyphus maynei TaxID=6958 RepID=A0A1Y3ANG0_EURMA|nr:hypothetical protein BLA29_008197 [Euroglyphus maynei]
MKRNISFMNKMPSPYHIFNPVNIEKKFVKNLNNYFNMIVLFAHLNVVHIISSLRIKKIIPT